MLVPNQLIEARFAPNNFGVWIIFGNVLVLIMDLPPNVIWGVLVCRNMRRRGHTGNVSIDHDVERLYLKVVFMLLHAICLISFNRLCCLLHSSDIEIQEI